MLKSIKRILLICVFGLLTVVLHLVGRYAPILVELIYPNISQNILRIVGGFFSVFPIAMWELLALAVFIWIIVTLVRAIMKIEILKWITGVALFTMICVFAYTLLWGLSNYAPPMHEKLDLSGREYSQSWLEQATIYYRDKANEAARKISRDEEGNMTYESLRALAEESTDSYMLLAVNFDCFRGPRLEPKRMILGDLLGIEGMFVPFTGESCVSGDVYAVCLPFEMCKQIGKGSGFTDRGEAEFAAFLACRASDSAELRYSGYFNAFSLCYNALYAKDAQAAKRIWQGVSQSVRADCAARVELETGPWRQAMSEFQTDLWDVYGKTFQDEEGKGPEHDSVTDLLTMWYVERII